MDTATLQVVDCIFLVSSFVFHLPDTYCIAVERDKCVG